MESKEKIVDFSKCKTCIHCDKSDYEDPCDECLNEPVNIDSHTPVKYEKKGE